MRNHANPLRQTVLGATREQLRAATNLVDDATLARALAVMGDDERGKILAAVPTAREERIRAELGFYGFVPKSDGIEARVVFAAAVERIVQC